MTPLEAMAKAIFMQEFEVADADNQIWERLTARNPALKQKQIAEARAGLLALAEVKSIDEVVRAMLRSIAQGDA